MMLANTRSFSIARLLLVAGLAVGSAVPAGASGQPGGPDQPPPREREGGREGVRDGAPMDADELRDFINRRLGEIDKAQARLREALLALDKGEEPGAVARGLREAIREGGPRNPRRDDGPGEGRGEGRGDGRGEGPRPRRDGGPEGPGGPGGPGGDGVNAPSAMGELLPPLTPGPRLSAEERRRVRAFIAERSPEIIAKIDELAGANPRAAERLVDGLGARLKALEGVRERDPAEFAVRIDELKNTIEIMRLSRLVIEAQRKKAPEEEIAKSKSALREVMDRQFDVRVALQRRQIDAVRKRLERLQGELDGAANARAKTVDEKMELLLRAMERGPGPRLGPGRDRPRPGEGYEGGDGDAPPPPPGPPTDAPRQPK